MTRWQLENTGFWQQGIAGQIETYLDNNYDINERLPCGWSVLHSATRHSNNLDVINRLLGAGANVNFREGEGRTPLHLAVEYCSNTDIVMALLDHKANPNARNKYGQTPLHLAAMKPTRDASEIIMALIKKSTDGTKGADGTLRDSKGKIPFDYAEKNIQIIDATRGIITDAYWELRESYWDLMEKEFPFDFSEPEPEPEPNPDQT